ncbi:hypothetical protein ALO80_101947 [Pseudomonas caricapapayae]|uniref:Uncharacterized protein n=1 Tax=Pseudomonas caricapapayae TaxID=46678 RepID=A0A0P9KD89_9PSED|nr:hypothetical protein ALO80_101947 [Pseudomonas caricapapayae]RMM09313.1 hypothetical protein ALQ84_101705 [Pseudomonas caricapapayae]
MGASQLLRISLRIHLLCCVDAGGRFRGVYSSASRCALCECAGG